MATAGSILNNARILYGDPDGDWLTDAKGLDFLDRAQRRFCNRVLPLDEFQDFAITAKKVRYDVNSDCITPVAAMWYQSRTQKLEYVTPEKMSRMEEANPQATGNPDYYTFIRRQLVVGPRVPQSNSTTSTASGAIQASVTTLGLAAASGTFRSKGYVKINSEVVEYTGVATTTLTGVTRGVHNTVAASHASGDTVTQIDLVMAYRRSPAAISASTSTPDIPAHWHDYLEKYALYLAWMARGDQAKADRAYAEFEQYEKDCIKTVGRRVQDGMMRIQEARNRVRW